ncbi:flagellar biosynthesis protein FlhF [Azomonas macrocytogenes]|uniref:Flagellar biosynthesis protein FlhF n=1 Tax=Azomonas macrocytogenes TaxID=69962 RepID=A0A839T261_AZOMA|nr:flagellar biosynthesis protein FlhF [Azomonas macrocytogenes]MBB3101823.1 flagellar biosynthesis protein FlhF [Azomonas macrocytogenes]
MQVKRFFAADMRQAMKLVRDELGADAAIIGNRRVAGGIELTAALDYPLQPAEPVKPNAALEAELRKTQAIIATAQARLSLPEGLTAKKDCQLFGERLDDFKNDFTGADHVANRVAEPAPEVVGPAPVAPHAYESASQDARGLDIVRSELHGLRELLETQLGSMAWSNMQQRQPNQAFLWRRLQRMGLPATVAHDLLAKVAGIAESQQAWRMLLAHFAQAVDVVRDDPMDEGGVIALVGPAGVGKTTTLSKLAARHVLQHGSQSIAIVSMDSFRIGAQEQLKTLGRILNVPIIPVGADQSLTQALAPLAQKKVVLIDTAGLPAADPAFRLQLEALASRGLRSKNYLALAATSQAQVLKAAWHSYKQCRLAGCVITKADEASTLGEVLGLAIGQRLPIAYFTDGPRIPDDLHRLRAHQLVSRAVSLQLAEEPSEDTMAAMFASFYNDLSRKVG